LYPDGPLSTLVFRALRIVAECGAVAQATPMALTSHRVPVLPLVDQGCPATVPQNALCAPVDVVPEVDVAELVVPDPEVVPRYRGSGRRG
jgi:hypothetical protein